MRPLLFENCRNYLLAHAIHPAEPDDRPLLRAVTISRETGAGAISVGQMLREHLEARQGNDPRHPWAVFDRELVKRVLRDHQLPAALEPYLPEDARPKVADVIEELLGIHPSDWTLVEHTKHTILRLARAGNVIIVGRGAHLVTAGVEHVFHVRLVAPFNVRIRHIRDYYKLSHDGAADFIQKEDRARSRYIQKHYRSNVQDPVHYHLTVNTGLIGFSEVARVIGDAVLRPPQS